MGAGPVAYAERWDEKTESYLGLVIEKAAHAAVGVDSDSVIVKPDVAEAHRPAPPGPTPEPGPGPTPGPGPGQPGGRGQPVHPSPGPTPPFAAQPHTFIATGMISAHRPARGIHQNIQDVGEQPRTVPWADRALQLARAQNRQTPGG